MIMGGQQIYETAANRKGVLKRQKEQVDSDVGAQILSTISESYSYLLISSPKPNNCFPGDMKSSKILVTGDYYYKDSSRDHFQKSSKF